MVPKFFAPGTSNASGFDLLRETTLTLNADVEALSEDH
jgi:hypothetical protein